MLLNTATDNTAYDCVDCAHYQQDWDRCRRCVNQGEARDVWLPLFEKRRVSIDDATPAEWDASALALRAAQAQKRPKVIGLAAQARAGKSTVAQYLAGHFGYVEMSFAAPIRRFISDLTGIPLEDLEKTEVKERVIPWIGKSPRQMMQTLGTEWGRELVSESLWVDAVMHKALRSDRPVVISDVRFENEAKAIREVGGAVIHLTRPGAPKVSAHKSEAGVAFRPGDFRIANDRDLATLFTRVNQCLGESPYELPV